MNIYRHNERFVLESGHVLPQLDIAYHTYGTLSPGRDNVIWVCHALTANSEVADWWPHTVEQGRFLDPGRYFIICANMIGSHYGSTGPLSINPSTGVPYYGSFPRITVRDVVKTFRLLADRLGIRKVKALIGSSIGGFHALEWLIEEPSFAEKAVLIATTAKASPWMIALNESQRMALRCDPTFGDKSDTAGADGLKCARSIALLSYRGAPAYNATQAEVDEPNKIDDFRAASYQRYQGGKLASRFNAYSYMRLTEMIDSHNVGRGRGGVERALASVKASVATVALTSDILCPVSDLELIYRHIPKASMHVISSEFGHDGFLIEHEKLNEIISKHLEA
ncbi:MAG: homoserine O-acetyltransferase [Rikenellaceae bacterium]|nr:homoserine O-acetyltransferase [Rikenellaceae bacterium]